MDRRGYTGYRVGGDHLWYYRANLLPTAAAMVKEGEGHDHLCVTAPVSEPASESRKDS